LYRKQLSKWRSRLDMQVHVTVDRASGDWRGNVDVVTTLIRRASFDPLQCRALVCGPEIMMRFSILELQKRGVEEDQIFVSMERNMKCGIGLCGHCQVGPTFVCKDGPVYRSDRVRRFMTMREI
jgi:NAD(P)H-flavin reductase